MCTEGVNKRKKKKSVETEPLKTSRVITSEVALVVPGVITKKKKKKKILPPGILALPKRKILPRPNFFFSSPKWYDEQVIRELISALISSPF